MLFVVCMYCVLFPLCATAEYQAGAAKEDITPPLGTPLNGYFDRLGRGALSVHDPIWARCLYLNDGTTGLFWVTADLCVINRELRDRVRELMPDELRSFPVILSATHNHSAQGGMIKPLLFRSVSGRFMPEVLESTAAGIVEAVRQAYTARKRAVLGYATFDQADLSVNRRFPEGPRDPQVGVIRVEDPDGNPIAVLTNFTAHPTSVGGRDMLTISADYPGFYYAELEQLAGGGCVAMLVNGAEGNQTCANPTRTEGWERTAAVGKILAQRVYGAAEKISCGELPLRYVTAEVQLPPTVAKTLLPETTTLQVLELGDLCVTFFPGEPCVEIGLELRRQVLARGYAAQFTAGVSNDYLLYFVPRALYPQPIYESAMNFYGPAIEDWFYQEFGKLLSRGVPAQEKNSVAPPKITPFDGGVHVVFAGSAREIGDQRAQVFGKAMYEAYERIVVKPCADGSLIPQSGLWRWAPPFLDLTEAALIRLAIGARPALKNVSSETFAEMEAVAHGAHMPFDAVWLLQYLPHVVSAGYRDELYQAPFCTMMAVLGERAGAEGLIVGRTLDDANSYPVIFGEYHLSSGKSYVVISTPWSMGGYSGMNDAGLVVCVESAPELGRVAVEGIPAHLIVRDLLEKATTAESAALLLMDNEPLHGYRFLLASPPVASPSGKTASSTATARVVDFGLTPATRLPADDLLLGCDGNSDAVDSDTRARYARAENLLKSERIVSSEEMREILLDTEGALSGRARICNADTRYAVIFEPRALRVSIAVRQTGGQMSGFETITLARGKG